MGSTGEGFMKMFILLVLGLLTACTKVPSVHGISNYLVVEKGIIRGGQPSTLEEWQWLKNLGVTDDLKLNFDSEASDTQASQVGIEVHTLSVEPSGLFHTFDRPDQTRLDQAENLLESRDQKIYFVHCEHGEDRTGLVIGRYLHLTQHWLKDDVYRYMLRTHFHPELLGLKKAWDETP
jgi:protein tyrosine/serine phosphatase